MADKKFDEDKSFAGINSVVIAGPVTDFAQGQTLNSTDLISEGNILMYLGERIEKRGLPEGKRAGELLAAFIKEALSKNGLKSVVHIEEDEGTPAINIEVDSSKPITRGSFLAKLNTAYDDGLAQYKQSKTGQAQEKQIELDNKLTVNFSKVIGSLNLTQAQKDILVTGLIDATHKAMEKAPPTKAL